MASASQRTGADLVDTPEAQAWARSAADWEWLRSHPEVWAEHAGRWICIVDQGVVLSEEDHDVFNQKLQRGGYLARVPLIMRVPLPAEWEAVRVR